MAKKTIHIVRLPSGTLIAQGQVGWAVTPFEGNWYISGGALKTEGFRNTALPGLCPYKFIYLWLDFESGAGAPTSKRLGWRYVLPNPLFPFIAFRVAVPGIHPELKIEIEES